MQNFAAIDFEIANHHHSSVCSVGVVIVRDGIITDKIYRLIHPEPEWYWWCLHTVAAHCGFNLTNHHHALANAEACAVIAMKILSVKNILNHSSLIYQKLRKL